MSVIFRSPSVLILIFAEGRLVFFSPVSAPRKLAKLPAVYEFFTSPVVDLTLIFRRCRILRDGNSRITKNPLGNSPTWRGAPNMRRICSGVFPDPSRSTRSWVIDQQVETADEWE